MKRVLGSLSAAEKTGKASRGATEPWGKKEGVEEENRHKEGTYNT